MKKPEKIVATYGLQFVTLALAVGCSCVDFYAVRI